MTQPAVTRPAPITVVPNSPTPTSSVSTSVPVATAALTPAPAATDAPETQAAGDPPCRAAQLAGSLGAAQGAAGQRYQPIVFTNTSRQTCAIQGFPVVALIDAAGNRISDPAENEESAAPGTVALAPGDVASALLHTTNAAVDGACLAPSAMISVQPPGQDDYLEFAGVYIACDGLFVRAIVAGPTGE